MLFISDLLRESPDELEATCISQLEAQSEGLNPWFFPSIPNPHLAPKDACRAITDLLSQMSKSPTFFKAVQYTLVLTLELDYNSRETTVFNECIDSFVKQDPKQYCLHSVVSPEYFTLWSQQATDSECTSAATQVVLDCSDNQCDACASLIGFIFARYSNLLEAEVNFLFKRIAKEQAKVLQGKNAFNEPTSDPVNVPSKLQIRSNNF